MATVAADELNLCISRSRPYGGVHRERLLLVASCCSCCSPMAEQLMRDVWQRGKCAARNNSKSWRRLLCSRRCARTHTRGFISHAEAVTPTAELDGIRRSTTGSDYSSRTSSQVAPKVMPRG